jgi:hypothetical protein
MSARWIDELACKYVELYKEHECLSNMNSTLYKRNVQEKCVGGNSEKNETRELHYRRRKTDNQKSNSDLPAYLFNYSSALFPIHFTSDSFETTLRTLHLKLNL